MQHLHFRGGWIVRARGTTDSDDALGVVSQQVLASWTKEHDQVELSLSKKEKRKPPGLAKTKGESARIGCFSELESLQ